MSFKTVMLVPRRDDGAHRDRLWAWCRNYWGRILDWPIIEGHHDGPEPFSRALATNRAALNVSSKDHAWDVAVIADSDVYTSLMQMMTAARAAYVYGAAIPYRQFGIIGKEETLDVISNKLHYTAVTPRVTFPYPHDPSTASVGGLTFVRRDMWEEVGGMDERFIGWGPEDRAFELTLRTIIGQMPRASGTAYGFWHAKSRDKNKASSTYRANKLLWDEYQERARDGSLLDWLKERRNATV